MNEKIKIGLALSGGGYRAAAFHLGTLRALDRLGILSRLDVISSVSGGSILAAYYGLHSDEGFSSFEEGFKKCLHKSSLNGFLFNFLIVLGIPIGAAFLCSAWCLFLYLLLIPFGFIFIPSSNWVAIAYDRIFFRKKKLNDLADRPVISINSTNIVTGRLFSFSKQDVGGYDYRKNGKSIIDGKHIPISFAVSCSTCVPSFFSPRKVSKKYFPNGEFKDNLLVDGGLYDNQGAYVLTESSNNLFRTNNVIVSDAGNSQPSNKLILNTLCLMNQSIEVLMNRIRTIQIRKNIYHDRQNATDDDAQFAYLSLRWSDLDKMPYHFVDNLKAGYVNPAVMRHHNITETDFIRLKTKNDPSIREEIARKFEKAIHWDDMLKRMPSEYTHKKAYAVSTNLIPLSDKQIEALSDCAAWLTELQIKTYLPHLLS